MSDQTTDNLHMLVGRLAGTVEALAGQVNNQTRAIEAQTQTFNSFEGALKHTNDDIRRLREEVVTPEVLRAIGISPDEPDEVKKDMRWLRDQREAHDKREPQMIKLKTAVMITVITSFAAFGVKWIVTHFTTAQAQPVHIETRDGTE